MTGPAVRVERVDGVAVLTLSRPARRNAMTAEMTAAWTAAVAGIRGDADVRCVVVTGEGQAFCAGGDLGWIAESPDLPVAALRDRMLAFYRDWLGIRDVEVPVIAAVNGPAIGAGLCLALACDLRYAGASARLSAPFVSLGMHAGMGATWLLPEVVGMAAARELLFTGRSASAEEARSIGLVSRVVDDDALLDEALTVARSVAAQAPLAVRLTKAALAGGGHASLEVALAWEAVAQPVTMVTEDMREGLRAASERRPPRFTGR